MGRRKLNIFIFIVSMLCSFIALIYMPDVLPSYFDSKGNIVRYASKYERVLMYPTVSILVNVLLDFIEKRKFDINHRYVSGFFKTYFIFFFAFENIKSILNAFNIKAKNSAVLIFIVEILMLIISWQYNIIRERNNEHKRRRSA